MLMTERWYRRAEAAQALGISVSTLRAWRVAGRARPRMTAAGQYVYPESEINQLMGREPASGKTIFYARDSSGSEDAINLQIEKLREAYGEPDIIIRDNGSGLSEKRPGMGKLLRMVMRDEVSVIHATSQDRVTRFGWEWIRMILEEHHATAVFLTTKPDESPHEELMQDFMSLIASFSGKFYRLRGWEQRRKLLRAAEDEIDGKA
jgi:putative resolvase